MSKIITVARGKRWHGGGRGRGGGAAKERTYRHGLRPKTCACLVREAPGVMLVIYSTTVLQTGVVGLAWITERTPHYCQRTTCIRVTQRAPWSGGRKARYHRALSTCSTLHSDTVRVDCAICVTALLLYYCTMQCYYKYGVLSQFHIQYEHNSTKRAPVPVTIDRPPPVVKENHEGKPFIGT